jgi:hypothetical protein
MWGGIFRLSAIFGIEKASPPIFLQNLFYPSKLLQSFQHNQKKIQSNAYQYTFQKKFRLSPRQKISKHVSKRLKTGFNQYF